MSHDEGAVSEERTCAECGQPVPAWPCIVVPQGDGSSATYHEDCSPWADEIAGQVVGGLELLDDDERRVVVDLVRALVDRDEPALRRVGAITEDRDDPYEATRRWRRWPVVDLVVPPGNPLGWEADVIGSPGQGWTVDVRMWTVQEAGPSDLVLHLDVDGSEVLYRGLWT